MLAKRLKPLGSFLTLVLLVIQALNFVHSTVGDDYISRLMSDFSGYGDTGNLNGFYAENKRDGIDYRSDYFNKFGYTSLLDKKEALIGGAQDVATAIIDSTVDLAKDKLDKKLNSISRLLNLFGIPIGDNPIDDLQNAMIGITTMAGSATDSISKVLNSDLEKVLSETEYKKDGFIQRESNIYKTIIRNFLLVDEGLNLLFNSVNQINYGICDQAEFTPPVKQRARFKGVGFKLTLNTGECGFSIQNRYLNFDFDCYCEKPYIKYEYYPAAFVSEYFQAAEYKTRECKKEIFNFEDVEAILHVFDGKNKFNPFILDDALFRDTFPMGSLKGTFYKTSLINDPLKNIFGHLLKGKVGLFESIVRSKLSKYNKK